MTDKELVMIKGIDVSKCRYFCIYDETCRDENIGHIVRPACKNVPDCCFKQLKRKEQECEGLKENETMLISNLQVLWGRKIAEEQGDCKNIDYTKPTTREIYNTISEIERTLKDVAFAQSVQIGKTKPLGETGSPRSYRNWENKLKKSLERACLK